MAILNVSELLAIAVVKKQNLNLPQYYVHKNYFYDFAVFVLTFECACALMPRAIDVVLAEGIYIP